jgi:hypothetical protein
MPPRSPIPALAGFAVAGLTLAACSESPGEPPQARAYADPGFVTAGNVRLHYALTLTSDLAPAIAGSYGILQRRNLALLTITIVPAVASEPLRLAAIDLQAVALSLLGERRALPMRRFDEDGGPTYLATVTVRHREPITIEIRARVAADGPEITARWTREFHLE